jgi:hypothetical protein
MANLQVPNQGDHESSSPPSSKQPITLEGLLSWPLRETEGVDKVIAGLRRIAEFQEVQPSQFFSDGPIELVNGYVLSFSAFNQRDRSIDIGIEQKPCFPAELAATITGAAASSVAQDAHGIDRGKFYVTERNGVTVSFTTTPLTYECVNSIYIDPAYRRPSK